MPLEAAGTGKVEDSRGQWDEIGKFTETLPGGVRHTIFKAGWDGPLDDTPVYKVPANAIFAMGDNRDNSLDSRVPQEEGGVGFVPAENLMARADVMLGSYDFLNARVLGAQLAAASFGLSRFLQLIDRLAAFAALQVHWSCHPLWRRSSRAKRQRPSNVTLGAAVIIASPLSPMLTGSRACGATRVSAKNNS